MKKMVRARIAEKTSSIGVAFRTGDEARLKWKGLKKEVTEKDNDCSATGGGRPKTRIIPLTSKQWTVVATKLHKFQSRVSVGRGLELKTMLLSVPHEMQQGPAIIELPEQVYTSQDPVVTPVRSRDWKAWLMKRRREASGSKQSRIEDEEESCVFKEFLKSEIQKML
ncbi:hypothetical protein BaRGS_00009647 [Batillaria attramentaria]|uniref:Uncharacterized protein n=1 Tax=Batillaria attramentaria TaxID=370345 RepID=A0ABD0LHY8_9CAEN